MSSIWSAYALRLSSLLTTINNYYSDKKMIATNSVIYLNISSTANPNHYYLEYKFDITVTLLIQNLIGASHQITFFI